MGWLFWILQLILISVTLFIPGTKSSEIEEEYNSEDSPKLLIILLDGFRWDYYERQKLQLPGFSQLVLQGVHVDYVEPIFPSLSFPSWSTIATGLYPENHNILGNYMLHLSDTAYPEEIVFQLKDNSTSLPWWWESAEPIWITATKNKLKVFMANWARCDVPFDGFLPAECTGYVYQNLNTKFRDDLNTAIKRFKKGFSLAMVYDDMLDHFGHKFGPDSNEIRLALVHRDQQIQELLINLQIAGLNNKVNVVLLSDHGMTNIKKDCVQFIHLSEYIDVEDVYKVIDYGAVSSIIPTPGKYKDLYKKLISIPGIEVYKKEEIPEEFHIKKSRLVHDFLLVAKPGYAMVGIKGDKQIPNDSRSTSNQPYLGSHGYYNFSDMRTIFYAKGPAFRKGFRQPAIRLEDEYQIFMRILRLEALPNNGTWANVQGMFKDLEGKDSCE